MEKLNTLGAYCRDLILSGSLSQEEKNKECKLYYLSDAIGLLIHARDLASDKVDKENIEYLIQLIQDTLEDY